MASSKATEPLKRVGLPVRHVRLECLAGSAGGTALLVEQEAATIGSAADCDLVIQDRTVSRYHAEVSRHGNALTIRDLGSTNGTRIGAVKVSAGEVEVSPPCTLQLGDVSISVTDGEVVIVEHGPKELGRLRARAPNMRRLLQSVQKAAASDVSVLILGESGTGKELVGEALHEHSQRKDAPFVTIDCGALSPTLFSSELFGHERGAFTGAERRHVGAFERAKGGTLFLDEVGELSPEHQSALLGVLERRQLRRLGGTENIPIDVRVVAATSRDLLAEVNSGKFRLDLIYRLAAVKLSVPPLRERPEDLKPLIEHFLAQEGKSAEFSTLFPPALLKEFQSHRWPGNVRELRNIVQGTLALGEAPQFLSTAETPGGSDPASTGALAATFTTADGELMPYRAARGALTRQFEQDYLKRLLSLTEGNVREAARRSGMNRSYLIELLTKHGLR